MLVSGRRSTDPRAGVVGQHGCNVDVDELVARACGYAPEVLTEHIATTLRFTSGMELSCQPLNGAGTRLNVVLC